MDITASSAGNEEAPREADVVARVARTRRGLLGALLAGLGSLLVLVLLWLISRKAPSAERDPLLTPRPLP